MPSITQEVLPPFEAKALLALNPTGLTTRSVTLTGTVDRKAGSTKDSGSIRLQSSSLGAESETWKLSSGDRVFLKTDLLSTRSCSATIAEKLQAAAASDIGCWRTVPWFSPWTPLFELSTQLTSSSVVTSSSDKAAGSVRLRFVPAYGDLSTLPTKALEKIAAIMQATSVDVVYDGTSALPKRLEYSQQTNGDPAAAVQVAVEYSDYRLESGLMLPHRIQRYLQRTLEADVKVTNIVTE